MEFFPPSHVFSICFQFEIERACEYMKINLDYFEIGSVELECCTTRNLGVSDNVVSTAM